MEDIRQFISVMRKALGPKFREVFEAQSLEMQSAMREFMRVETGHAPGWSPSSAWLAALCSMSPRLSSRAVEVGDDMGMVGTRLHKLLEIRVPKQDFRIDDPLIEFPDLLEDEKEQYRELLVATGIHLNDLQLLADRFEYDTEVKVSVRLEGEVVTFGTVDLVVLSPDRIAAVDYKFSNSVYSRDRLRWQALFYALGVMQKHDVPTLEFHFVFPRMGAKESFRFTREECVREIQAFLEQIETPRYLVGDHCHYCKALYFCPKVVERSERMESDLRALRLDGKDSSGSVVKAVLSVLSHEELDRVQSLADASVYLKPAMDKARTVVKSALVAGEETFSGWYLDSAGSMRREKL